MSRFGVWIHPAEHPTVEAWGELCISTEPDLQACVLRVLDERPGEPVVVDLRRVWFCDLAGLRSLSWLVEHGSSVGARIEVRTSHPIARTGRLVHHVRAARIASPARRERLGAPMAQTAAAGERHATLTGPG
jgi:anti-anti-sigma regulatory factor